MMTPFGLYEPLVLPPAAADDDGIAAFDGRVDVMSLNFARGRPRSLNGTTFVRLGTARAAGIGVPTVKVRGRLPIEMLFSRPEVLGISIYKHQTIPCPSG